MAELDPGSIDAAGASARAEHSRRREARQARDRDRYGKTVGAIATRLGTPAHETAWARGAEGEAAVGKALAERCGPEVVVLHDRLMPGRRRANIDHLAIAPSGVWVIDTKRYRGKASVKSPLLGRRTLVIDGRDQTKLVDVVRAQAEAIEALLASAGHPATVIPALCFVDTELPVLGLPTVNGVVLTGRRGLAKRVNATGALPVATIRLLAAELDERLTPASRA